MKRWNQLALPIGLLIMGSSNLQAAPITNDQVLDAVTTPEFTHWAPGNRAQSVSFPVYTTELERFMESADGIWIVAPVVEPLASKDLSMPSADLPSCPWGPKAYCATREYGRDFTEPSVGGGSWFLSRRAR